MSALWKICIDDTADERGEKYVCAGALMGSKEDRSNFNKTWRRKLGSSPAIRCFHGKDVHKLSGEFAQFRDKVLYPPPLGMDAAIAKRNVMRAVIESSELIGFGAGVLVPEYQRIRDSHPRGKYFMPKSPFGYVLQEVIYRTTKELARYVGNLKVQFISDRSNRSSEYERVYADWKRWNPETAMSMLALTHEDDKRHYGLQAADVAASTVNLIFRSHVETGTVPKEYALSERFWRIGRIDEKYLLSVLEHQTPREAEFNVSARATTV
ncbi:MAG: DUF3800 domain-containing protein [Acidobacteriota bacterium]|nr:DUF3800 domain-containing protein [Acidobacteriota bacterium]